MPAPDSYSGLTLWIEADGISGLSNGDYLDNSPNPPALPPYDTWPDSSAVPSADDIYAETDLDFVPRWYTRVRCNKPAVRFVQTTSKRADLIQTRFRTLGPALGRDSITGPTGYTGFTLFRVNSIDGGGFNLWGRVDSNGETGLGVKMTDGSSMSPGGVLTLIAVRKHDVSGIEFLFLPIDVGTWYLAETWWDGSSLNLAVNGESPLSIASGGVPGAGFDPVEIGGDFSIGVNWEFDLCGHSIFDEGKDSATRAALRDYWQRKYGLAPYSCGSPTRAWIIG